MVESEADQLSEGEMLGAVVFGHEQMQTAIDAIHRLVEKAGKPAWEWESHKVDEAVTDKIYSMAEKEIEEAYLIQDKQDRSSKLKEIYESVIQNICSDLNETSEDIVNSSFISKFHIKKPKISSSYIDNCTIKFNLRL